MVALAFSVGEQPIDPLVLTLTNDDGTVIDLTGLTVTLLGEGLPAGTTTLADAAAGKVQYNFTAPFTEAGVVDVRARLESGGATDYTAYVQLNVSDATEPAVALISPAYVETITGAVVSRRDVARAQQLVSLVVGRDLFDALVTVDLTVRDLRLLKYAVAWQSAESSAEVAGVPAAPRGVSALSLGDISISYSGESGAGHIGLAPLAQLALNQVSWRRRQLSAVTAEYRVRPDPWVLIAQYGHL